MSVALGIEHARPREEAPPPLTRQPAFVRFWAGQTISVFGDQISALAIPLTAVLALHASALEVGILTALAWLPHLLFSLPAGVWIDRRAHQRENMIVADVARGARTRNDPSGLVARSADDLAPAGGGIRSRSVDRLLRPLERHVLRRARAPLSVRRREQQVLDDALALVHRGPEHRRLPRPGLHGAGRADGRCALLRRLGDRAARRPRPGAEGREQRDERAGRPCRRLPLPRAPARAASGRRLHEHHQLLQLLRLRDLRPLREPHPRA